MVAEKRGMYRWGDNKFFCKLSHKEAKFGHTVNLLVACTAGAIISLSIFYKLGGNEAEFGHAVNLWVGTRTMLK